MFKESDEIEDSDKFWQTGQYEVKTCKTSSNLYTEKVEISDSTSNSKLSQEKHPQKEDISKNLSEKNTSVAEAEESNKENVCKNCGENFKDFEGILAHNCLYKDIEKSSFHIFKVFDPLQENKSKLAAENSFDGNISVSSTSKISPSSKISQDISSQSLSLAASKQIFSPSTKTLIGDSSRSLTSSVAPHKWNSSRISLPAFTTKHSEREEHNIAYTNYPMYVTPPQALPPFQALKHNSLNVRDLTAENLLELHKSSCISNEYRSLPSECIKKDSVLSLTLATPEQRSFSSPQNIRVEPSRSVTRSKESYNLQSPGSFCIASTERLPEVEELSIVHTKYPTFGTPPRIIPSSHTRNDESSRRVLKPIPVKIVQSPYLCDATIKTSSPEIKLEKYDSPKSSTFVSPKPVSSFKKSNEDSSRSEIDTTISDISPKEELTQTEGEISDNYPGYVKVNVMK
ncbi:hypothetical protein TNCV_951011 [Trichonephila clavipes]|nr:hypothetical protein TNCV_951011 [Trichonephila clavipes]